MMQFTATVGGCVLFTTGTNTCSSFQYNDWSITAFELKQGMLGSDK